MPTERESIVLAAGWLAVVGLGFGLLVYPKHREATVLRADIARLTDEASRPSDGPEVIEALDADLEALRRRGEQRMTPIPQDKGIAELMRDLSARLDSMGLARRELNTGSDSQLEEASMVPLSMTLDGTFPQIYEVTRYLESLPRLVRLQRLRIAAAAGERGAFDRSGVVRADLMLDVFYRPRAVSGATASATPMTEGTR